MQARRHCHLYFVHKHHPFSDRLDMIRPYSMHTFRTKWINGSVAATQMRKMTSQPRPVRGMVDRYGASALKHRQIVEAGQNVSELYAFEPISTPILEYSSVYERSLGEDSDVVGKELYKFLDSSNQWMTMRPEGTAGVIRALISNKLDLKVPQRVYYSGPMFRHERPQKGRLRQFEQFGVEAVGIMHPALDVECIDMAWRFLHKLEIDGDLSLHLNTLGDNESRIAYRKALSAYFSTYTEKLSSDSQNRLKVNPLRILDSKDECDREIVMNAPVFEEYLNSRSKLHFDFVMQGLKALNIPFTLNNRLVRGLDYYQHTVWEVVCNSSMLGRSQATVLAGGRYDGLTKALGGSRSLPGIGWAAGIERLALLLPEKSLRKRDAPIPILIVPEQSKEDKSRIVDNDLYIYAIAVAQKVRSHNIKASIHHPTVSNQQTEREENKVTYLQLSKQLNQVFSTEQQPNHIIIIGRSEMAQNTVIVRDPSNRSQRTIPLELLVENLGA